MYVPNMGAVTLAEAVSAATAAKQNQNPHHASAAGVSATAGQDGQHHGSGEQRNQNAFKLHFNSPFNILIINML